MHPLAIFCLLAAPMSSLLVTAERGGGPTSSRPCAPCDPSGGPAQGACLAACEAARTLNAKWLQQAKGEWEDTQFWGSGNAVQALTDYSLYADQLIGSRAFEISGELLRARACEERRDEVLESMFCH